MPGAGRPTNLLRKRTVIVTAAGLVLLLALGLGGFFFAAHQRAGRRRVFRAAPIEVKPKAATSAELRPVSEWSEQFRLLEAAGRWGELAALLGRIEHDRRDLYDRWSLGYLHARALIEGGVDDHRETLLEGRGGSGARANLARRAAREGFGDSRHQVHER